MWHEVEEAHLQTVRRPRSWYLEAVRRLEGLGYVRHVLDPCLFLLFEEPQNDNEAETEPQLVAALGLHVDDIFGIINPQSSFYNKYLDDLKGSFSFRDFRVDPAEFEFLGAQVERTSEGALLYHHANYLGKVKPITISKERVNSPDLPITEGERTQLRAAIGAIQWAATQTSPHLQAHTSYLAGDINNATIATLLEANKMLRFAKANSDVGLEYSPLGTLDELTMVTFSDAAFASRQNHASQGGFLVTMVNKSALESGTASKYHILNWRSFKLARVARSTLAAEGQAASEAADAHLFATTFLKAMTTGNYHLQQPDPYSWIKASALVIDAKALYDVLSRDALQATSSSDKRTFLEALVTRDKLREAKAQSHLSANTQMASRRPRRPNYLRTDFEFMSYDSWRTRRIRPQERSH